MTIPVRLAIIDANRLSIEQHQSGKIPIAKVNIHNGFRTSIIDSSGRLTTWMIDFLPNIAMIWLPFCKANTLYSCYAVIAMKG